MIEPQNSQKIQVSAHRMAEFAGHERVFTDHVARTAYRNYMDPWSPRTST